MQLWCQFFQIFVYQYGDVVFMLKLGRYWPWKTVSNHLNAIIILCIFEILFANLH